MAGLRLASWNLVLRVSPADSNWPWRFTVPRLRKLWFMLNTCFPSGSQQFWYLPGSRCLSNQPSMKTLAEAILGFLGHRRHHLCVAAFHCCVSLHAGSPQRVPSDSACVFPPRPAVYPQCINVAKLSRKNNYRLSPTGPSSKSLNVGGLGGPRPTSIRAVRLSSKVERRNINTATAPTAGRVKR